MNVRRNTEITTGHVIPNSSFDSKFISLSGEANLIRREGQFRSCTVVESGHGGGQGPRQRGPCWSPGRRGQMKARLGRLVAPTIGHSVSE